MTATQRIIARVAALASAYFAVSLLERMAAAAEADAAAARLAAAAADEALFAHLTGPCGCAGDVAEDLAAAHRRGYGEATKDAGRLFVRMADDDGGGE